MAIPGFHVNSNKPGGEYTVPLDLTWAPGPLRADLVSYPQASQLKVGTETLNVFSGTFTLQTEFQVPDNAPTGALTVTGKIHYQACNNLMCFRPATLDVHIPVLIE